MKIVIWRYQSIWTWRYHQYGILNVMMSYMRIVIWRYQSIWTWRYHQIQSHRSNYHWGCLVRRFELKWSNRIGYSLPSVTTEFKLPPYHIHEIWKSYVNREMITSWEDTLLISKDQTDVVTDYSSISKRETSHHIHFEN